jgi:histidyl-tRNA synthetase
MTKKIKNKTFQAPRGTHDILPPAQPYWDKIRKITNELSSYYGYGRIATPHIEDTELFLRAVGETSDIVEKQMYSFRTRGGDALTLRPEGTAPIARAYIENGLVSEPHPVKLWYFGEFFRHEAPQKGRYREFNQWGLESIGDESVIAEAEIMHIFSVALQELGFNNYVFHVNSIGCSACRPAYRSQLLQYYRSRIKGLCKDCKERYKANPLRLLDCKEEKCEIAKKGAPQMIEHLCEQCKNHFTLLLEFLDEDGVPYLLNSRLVRGLDYYARTVFEIFLDESADVAVPAVAPETPAETPAVSEQPNVPDTIAEKKQEPEKSAEAVHEKKMLALGSGGRYDGLIETIGGRPTPAAGGAMGIERLVALLKQRGMRAASSRQKVFFVQLGDLAKKKSFRIMEELRNANIPVGESIGKPSVKSQLKLADKHEAQYSLILGQKEAIDNTIIIREMSSGIQETILREKMVDTLKKKLRK